MPDPTQPLTPFASRTLLEHILRGAAAAGLIAVAITNAAESSLVSGAAVLVAVVLLRGCPMCWMVGFVETLLRTRRASCACDGRTLTRELTQTTSPACSSAFAGRSTEVRGTQARQ